MLWIVVLGIATGMRTMTAMAVLCWFAWLQLLPLEGTWAFWAGNVISVCVFTLFALGEYVGDTLPQTPSRKALGPASARIIFGALVGAIAAVSLMEPAAGGILLGVVGALIGTHAGYACRMRGAAACGSDRPAALAESALAVAMSLGAMWMLHLDAIGVMKVESRTFF